MTPERDLSAAIALLSAEHRRLEREYMNAHTDATTTEAIADANAAMAMHDAVNVLGRIQRDRASA